MIKGIFGGTFDPIHCGHLEVAEYLSSRLPFSAIHFIPCFLPPHRQAPNASPEHRLTMIKIAISGHPQWIADDIDFKRRSPSYMVDTLKLLHRADPPTTWCLIVGMDAFAKFNGWHEWQEILKLCHLVVVNRPGFDKPKKKWTKELLAEHGVDSAEYFQHHSAGGILFYQIPPSRSPAPLFVSK